MWNQNSYKDRSIYELISTLDKQCKKNDIPKIIIDNAKILLRNIKAPLRYEFPSHFYKQ